MVYRLGDTEKSNCSMSQGVRKFSFEGMDISILGIVYIPGMREGEESLKAALKSFSWDRPFQNQLCGCYCCILKKEGKVVAFCDNSGLFRVFYTSTLVSDRFLEIVKSLNGQPLTLNKENVYEFIRMGIVYMDTIVDQIKVLRRDEYIYWDTGKQEIRKKERCSPDDPPCYNVEDFLHLAFESLKDYHIDIDLTGGTDSRMILAFLKKENKQFSTSISGSNEHEDVIISRKVAAQAGLEWIHVKDEEEDYSEDYSLEVFWACDGQSSFLENIRLNKYYSELAQRGYNLHLSGIYGNFFKDHPWLQDFPFYNSRVVNFKRHIKYRIVSMKFPDDVLDEEYSRIGRSYTNIWLERIAPYRKRSNTQSYDFVELELRLPGPSCPGFTLARNSGILSYDILADLELVRNGYRLPRTQRFFNRFHRSIITKYAPEVSKIRTDKGLTCSDRKLDVLGDVMFTGIDYARRLYKQLYKKATNKARKTIPVNNVDSKNYLSFQITKRALDRLRKECIIRSDVEFDQLDKKYLRRLIAIGLILLVSEGELAQEFSS